VRSRGLGTFEQFQEHSRTARPDLEIQLNAAAAPALASSPKADKRQFVSQEKSRICLAVSGVSTTLSINPRARLRFFQPIKRMGMSFGKRLPGFQTQSVLLEILDASAISFHSPSIEDSDPSAFGKSRFIIES